MAIGWVRADLTLWRNVSRRVLAVAQVCFLVAGHKSEGGLVWSNKGSNFSLCGLKIMS